MEASPTGTTFVGIGPGQRLGRLASTPAGVPSIGLRGRASDETRSRRRSSGEVRGSTRLTKGRPFTAKRRSTAGTPLTGGGASSRSGVTSASPTAQKCDGARRSNGLAARDRRARAAIDSLDREAFRPTVVDDRTHHRGPPPKCIGSSAGSDCRPESDRAGRHASEPVTAVIHETQVAHELECEVPVLKCDPHVHSYSGEKAMVLFATGDNLSFVEMKELASERLTRPMLPYGRTLRLRSPGLTPTRCGCATTAGSRDR